MFFSQPNYSNMPMKNATCAEAMLFVAGNSSEIEILAANYTMPVVPNKAAAEVSRKETSRMQSPAEMNGSHSDPMKEQEASGVLVCVDSFCAGVFLC